jgi:Tol biopolymer transport system component
MNLDGSGRTKVADNGREACWSPDGKRIAYLKGEFDRFVYEDFATKGIGIYDLATGQRTDHPNKDLFHLYNLCWSPDGNWFVATVHAGMGYKHAILAVEAAGTKVFDLEIPGCRPDISPDGKKIAWGASDWDLYIGDLDLASAKPKVTHGRPVARSAKPMKIYHVDWSPDGKYVAFSRGPERKSLGQAPEIIGIKARDWNICVADSSGESVWLLVTSDGNCNKEPDWAPVPQKGGQ